MQSDGFGKPTSLGAVNSLVIEFHMWKRLQFSSPTSPPLQEFPFCYSKQVCHSTLIWMPAMTVMKLRVIFLCEGGQLSLLESPWIEPPDSSLLPPLVGPGLAFWSHTKQALFYVTGFQLLKTALCPHYYWPYFVSVRIWLCLFYPREWSNPYKIKV